MFEFPEVDFSELICSDELEIVGLESTTDLVKPAIIAFLKDGIQRNIRACNLSKKACDELLEAYEDEGFQITLDENIQPDVSALPEFFSSTDEAAEKDAEHQRALNYASWVLEESGFDQETFVVDHVCAPTNAYPLNLLNAIFGERKYYVAPSLNLCTIIEEACDNVLDTITLREERALRAIYQRGVKDKDIIRAVGVETNKVATWAIRTLLEEVVGKALRKLRHPSRSKQLKEYFKYLSYLENVEGSTLDDIKKSFLYEKNLSWENKWRDKETIDWDTQKKNPEFPTIFDVNEFPTNLIYDHKTLPATGTMRFSREGETSAAS